MACTGKENSLLHCNHNKLSAALSCGDGGVAGATCLGMTKLVFMLWHYQLNSYNLESCTEGTVRLSGSSKTFLGRVEICLDLTWTTICDEHWDFKDAQVVCRELGYSPYGITVTSLMCYI